MGCSQAINCYQSALEIVTQAESPEYWAGLLMNLGVLYSNRFQEEKELNLEIAIEYFTEALTVYTRENFPRDYGNVLSQLGNAYYSRIQGEKAKNLERAIACHRDALSVFNAEEYPNEWAMVQHNLGNAYLEKTQEDREENIEAAIACYENAERINRRESFPEGWGMVQHNLGNTYQQRIQGDRVENLQRAIAYLKAALEVRTREAFPLDYLQTVFVLSEIYRDLARWEEAYKCLHPAIDALEGIRGEICSEDATRRKLSERWQKLYQRMVEACWQMGRETEALEYAERSKARNLLEAIDRRDNSKSMPNESRKIEPMPYSRIHSLVDNRTTLVEWFFTEKHLLAFIVGPSGKLTVLDASRKNLKTVFDDYLQKYPETREKRPNWRGALPSLLHRFAEVLKIEEIIASLPRDSARLILVPHLFLHYLPLHALPLADGSFLADRFTVGYAPSCQLLHKTRERPRPDFHCLFAVQDPGGDLPGCAIEIATLDTYFAPRDIFVGKEATKAIFYSEALPQAHCIHLACHGFHNVRSPLHSAIVLAEGVVSTPENADTRDWPVVSLKANSEGFSRVFWLQLARRDGLVGLMYMAGFFVSRSLDLSKCLTLEDIFSLDLSRCALVTLSACETGLTDITSTSDEYIGLSGGFLFAGSSNVVSSLWLVDDLASALLMVKFYEYLFAPSENSHRDVAVALNRARIWLRDITKRELLEWCDPPRLSEKIRRSILEDPRIKLDKPDRKPFASPVFWAAFQAIGR